MYTDLRDFDAAKKFLGAVNQDIKGLLIKQADWALRNDDLNAAWYANTDTSFLKLSFPLQ